MGLDFVELILETEKKFEIEVKDNDAPQLVIVGDMYNYVCNCLRLKGEHLDATEIWNRLVDIYVHQLGVDPTEVQLTTHIVNDLGAL